MYKNYLLCIDVKTLLQRDTLARIGKTYRGCFILDDDWNATFVEDVSREPQRRNPRVFDGNYITMTYRLSDGHVRLNFKSVQMGEGFNADEYAIGVMEEVRTAMRGLVEKGGCR